MTIPFYFIVSPSYCTLTLIPAHSCFFLSMITSPHYFFFPPSVFSYFQLMLLYPLLCIPPGSLICISFPTSSPFSLLQHPWHPLSTHLFLTRLWLYFFLSLPFSVHLWIPCHLQDFCLFLCICQTSYSLHMYLSHFQKQCCQSFPRELDWTAPIDTMATLINHRGNQSWYEPLFPCY